MILEILILNLIPFLSLSSTDVSEPVIKNYWEHIQELMKEAETFREKEPDNISTSKRIQNKRYPFDLFRKLQTRELIRAGREAIESARKEGKMKNWSEEEVELKCEENLSLVFEYLGFTIDRSTDIDIVIYCIAAEKEEPLLRLYLLKNCHPEAKCKTLFGLHMRKLLETKKMEWQKALTDIVKRTSEIPQIQIEAIDILYLYYLQQYQEVLSRDPVYQAHSIQNNLPISILWLEDPSVPKPLETTQAEINQINSQLNEFISILGNTIKDPNPQKTEIKFKAKETIEKILHNLPYSSKERLKELLALVQ